MGGGCSQAGVVLLFSVDMGGSSAPRAWVDVLWCLVGVGNYNNYGVWTTDRFLFSGGLASESRDGSTLNWE